MKILKRTIKQFIAEDVESLFGYKDFTDNNDIIAEIQVPFESDIAQDNVKYINKNMSNDDETIDYLIDNQEDLDEIPVIMYREYLALGIEYYTRIKDGKICREAAINDALKDITTRYDVAIESEQIVLRPWNLSAELSVWNYETINEAIPKIVKALLDNGYVTIEDIEEEESRKKVKIYEIRTSK